MQGTGSRRGGDFYFPPALRLPILPGLPRHRRRRRGQSRSPLTPMGLRVPYSVSGTKVAPNLHTRRCSDHLRNLGPNSDPAPVPSARAHAIPRTTSLPRRRQGRSEVASGARPSGGPGRRWGGRRRRGQAARSNAAGPTAVPPRGSLHQAARGRPQRVRAEAAGRRRMGPDPRGGGGHPPGDRPRLGPAGRASAGTRCSCALGGHRAGAG